MRSLLRPPLAVPLVGCVLQYVGFQWDIAWHIIIGRDSFWILPHWLVYFGVALVLVSGLFPIWQLRGRAQIGSYALAASALAQVTAAPIDDLWHRLYGVDNTLWSPPHLAFILASAASPLALTLFTRDRRGVDLTRESNMSWQELGLRWKPSELLRSPSLLLCALALACLDFTMTEFRYRIPETIFPWDFALFPPLMIAITLFAAVIGLTLSRRAGAITMVCAFFTAIAILVNLEVSLAFSAPLLLIDPVGFALSIIDTQIIPMLLPSALVADLILVRLRRLSAVPRLTVAALAFAIVFYAVQFPYSWLVPPVWSPQLLYTWHLTLWLSPLAATAGFLVGLAILRAPEHLAPRRRTLTSDNKREYALSSPRET